MLSDSGVISPLLINNQNSFGVLQEPTGNEIITYTVVRGDTIQDIANKFGVSKETIIAVNNLANANYLKEGQELLILPIDGVIHKVKAGQTVSEIAALYGVNIKKIIDYNILTEDAFVRVGDILIIPGAKPLKIQQALKTSKHNTTGLAYLYEDLPQYNSYYLYPTVKESRNWGILHRNNAVDIATDCGNEIYAAASGTIRRADSYGYNGGYGKYVIIDHPNQTSTLYSHMSKILVEQDDYVNQGDIIGLIGSTGRSTGCHVHFEVRGAKNPFAKY